MKIHSYPILKPLVVFLGILKYDVGVFTNLGCVPTDFENIVKSLNCDRGYSVAYYTNENKLKLIDENNKSVSHHKDQLKLYWLESDISTFNFQIYKKYFGKKNCKYDSLFYFISSHGNDGGIIYDSKGESIPLVTIFDQFNNEYCPMLRNKPKIYWISACRGLMITKRYTDSALQMPISQTQIVEELNINDSFVNVHCDKNTININDAYDDENKSAADQDLDSKQSETITSNNTTTTIADNNSNNIGNNDLENNKIVKFNKNNCNLRSYNKFNYNRIIYANTSGYAVVEPSNKGEYMIRSVCKVFEDDNILSYDFDQVIVQIRKVMIKLMGVSESCAAQVIDDHNDIPCNIVFVQKETQIDASKEISKSLQFEAHKSSATTVENDSQSDTNNDSDDDPFEFED